MSSLPSAFARITASPLGVFAILAIAAYLEVYGDACFQNALFHSIGSRKILGFAAGTIILALYSLFLNSSGLDFGKLLGLYVVLFFVIAQLVAWLKFDQRPTPAIYAGGSLIILGGVVMSVWRS